MKKVKRITPRKFREKEQEKRFDEKYATVVDALKRGDEISGLNEAYRETPYNLKNQKDLIAAIENTFCELQEWIHLEGFLVMVEEDLDQSIEIYEPKVWMYGSDEPNLYVDAAKSLSETLGVFDKLIKEKQEEFEYLIELAIDSPSRKVNELLFNDESMEIEDKDKFIESLMDNLIDISDEYAFNIEDQKKKLPLLMLRTLGRLESEE